MNYEGKTWRSHRVVWTITHGPIPEGMCVCHRCDNPPCCNPAHFWLGTQQDNIQDRHRKGRSAGAVGDLNASRKHPERRPRGEHHSSAKLTEDQARAIKASVEPTRFLVKRYGVYKTVIQRIRRGQLWKCIQ